MLWDSVRRVTDGVGGVAVTPQVINHALAGSGRQINESLLYCCEFLKVSLKLFSLHSTTDYLNHPDVSPVSQSK